MRTIITHKSKNGVEHIFVVDGEFYHLHNVKGHNESNSKELIDLFFNETHGLEEISVEDAEIEINHGAVQISVSEII